MKRYFSEQRHERNGWGAPRYTPLSESEGPKQENPSAGSIHTVFSVDGSLYQRWQADLLAYSHEKVGQPGPLTRLLSADGPPTPFAGRTFHTKQYCPHPVTGDYYPQYNRLMALTAWLEESPPVEEVILLLDPDCVFLAPLLPTELVSPGSPVSHPVGYMDPAPKAALLQRHCSRPELVDAVGIPTLIHRDDLMALTPLWVEKTEEIRSDPRSLDLLGGGWVADMWGYTFVAAELGLRHTPCELALAQHEDRADLPIIHYCYSSSDDEGHWTWDKRSYKPGERVPDPPDDVPSASKALIGLLNEWVAMPERQRTAAGVTLVSCRSAALPPERDSPAPRSYLGESLAMSGLDDASDSIVRARILDFEVAAPGPRSERSLGWLKYLHGEIFNYSAYFFMAKRVNPFILDCGSNIGISILFFKALYPEAKILGFEPHELSHTLLQKNISSNALDKVQVHRAALGSEDSKVDLYWDPQDPGSLGMSTIRDIGSGKAKALVQQVKLSRFIYREVDFLKLDVEGAEDAVLEDLVSSGAISNVDQMVVEYHHHIDKEKDAFSIFLAQLEQSGFGYQISGHYDISERASLGGSFQCVHVYAYRKSTAISFAPEVQERILERRQALTDPEAFVVL